MIMKTVTEEEPEDLSHDGGDSVSELRRRLEALWRLGEHIANSEGDPELQREWREIERQEQNTIKRLKQKIFSRIENGDFPNEF